MDDLTSRDEEQKQEMAREKGRQEEQRIEHERELAMEKGRKQGLEEERARQEAQKKQKSGRGSGLRILLYLIVIIVIALVIAILTLSVTVTNVTSNYALPFTTSYAVTFPEGQSIAIGNSHISVLSYQNELISDIDGDRQKLVIGEDRIISERRAVITTLGVIRLLDTNFQINLKYKGDRDNLAYFDMAVQTSQQVPDVLLRQLLPAEIHATPI